MNKKVLLLILFLFTLLLSGCVLSTQPSTSLTTTSKTSTQSETTSTSVTTTRSTTSSTTTKTVYEERYQTLELFSLNDFHGGAYNGFNAISAIGEFLKYKKEYTDHTIIVANGDIFQGSAFSNYYHGRPLIDIMNEIGFDAFVIGNHEFDWGIDEIALYNDELTENGEAEFPFLAANIVTTDEGEMMPWTDPYTILEINGVRVGIIGVIGDVINSIAASRVEGYTFENAAAIVKEYAYQLRTEENCHVVIASIHEYDATTNRTIASYTGDYRVDAIFNGHTHQHQAKIITRAGADLPYAQISNYSSSMLAKITLIYDRETGLIVEPEDPYTMVEILSESDFPSRDPAIDAIIEPYATDSTYLAFINEELVMTKVFYGQSDLAPWGASVIRDYLGIDVGFVNAGGFKVIMESGIVTMGDLVGIYPFDNVIKTSQMTGSQLNDFCDIIESNDIVPDQNAYCNSGTFYIDGAPVNPTTLYTVGAVDYIFDKTYYMFLEGINVTYTGYFMRDLLVMDLRNHDDSYFNPYNGTSYPQS